MKSRYIVSYDVSNAARWRKLYKWMMGFGDPLHYSVFQCDLTPSEHQRMVSGLRETMHLQQDRVLLIDLGPSRGRGPERVTALGRPCRNTAEGRIVVVA